MNKKIVVTITGIRPDFIRMSEIFKKFDENFNHILIHTGQHFDTMLSDVFFNELKIRKPDYNLQIGGEGREHFHQTADLSVKVIELFREKNINPDIICFLGDSNSVVSAVSLKKEGYKIAHIEAGMRSYDKRMLEEINRVVCDHCSDYLFVYHDNYKRKAVLENICPSTIHVVGNTIVEVYQNNFDITDKIKKNDLILLDIHRPENFKYKNRLENIILYANDMSEHFNIPVKMLSFSRTNEQIENFNIDLKNIEMVPLMSYKEYINTIFDCKFIISDSGTAQEEPALVNTPVVVPRNYTERPESVKNNCSYMINVDEKFNTSWYSSIDYLNDVFNKKIKIKTEWLGDGKTSQKVVDILKSVL